MHRPKSKASPSNGNKPHLRFVAILFLLLCCRFTVQGQETAKGIKDSLCFRVLFWNVENLFDTRHDSLKQDTEFLPTAIRKWTPHRYWKKLNDVAQVVAAAGQWEPPALIGLCEVENDSVLRDLTRRSPLRHMNYRYLMTQSPDRRGLDVALLYRRDLFKPITHQGIRIAPPSKHEPTRDILHVEGLLLNGDTLDVFVCHFPSRARGKKATEAYRIHCAHTLKEHIEQLANKRQQPRTLIMGDFNDYPHDDSFQKVLQVLPAHRSTSYEEATLYELLSHQRKVSSQGTYKHNGRWGILDHFLISGSLLNAHASFFTHMNQARIVMLPFLLTDDLKSGGKEPFRTYRGMKYQGGFSDHLPILLDFKLILPK